MFSRKSAGFSALGALLGFLAGSANEKKTTTALAALAGGAVRLSDLPTVLEGVVKRSIVSALDSVSYHLFRITFPTNPVYLNDFCTVLAKPVFAFLLSDSELPRDMVEFVVQTSKEFEGQWASFLQHESNLRGLRKLRENEVDFLSALYIGLSTPPSLPCS